MSRKNTPEKKINFMAPGASLQVRAWLQMAI